MNESLRFDDKIEVSLSYQELRNCAETKWRFVYVYYRCLISPVHIDKLAFEFRQNFTSHRWVSGTEKFVIMESLWSQFCHFE